MERYIARKGDTLSTIAKRFNCTLSAVLAVNPNIKNPDLILIGQFVRIPVSTRHAPGTPTGPTIGEIFGKGAVLTGTEPAKDARYLDNAIVAVGIPIWGAAFALYRKVVNGQGTEAVMLPRSDASLGVDPLKDSFSDLCVAYATRADALAALSASRMPNPYAYYIGDAGLIFPTIISDSTTPRLCKALRHAVEDERKTAQAAEKLAIQLLIWYVGARLPVKSAAEPIAAKTGAAATDALAGFSAAERTVIGEAKQILSSPEMMQIRQAQALGKDIVVKIGGRVIQYEPGMPASGLTNFAEKGFVIGREAFTSEAELTKTILHELYRLRTSVLRGSADTAGVTVETKAAFEFAERAYSRAFASAAAVGAP